METSKTTTRVRYGETSQMGVAYHANYLHYLDLGRTEYLRARGCSIGELERRGVFLPVVEISEPRTGGMSAGLFLCAFGGVGAAFVGKRLFHISEGRFRGE